MISVAFMIAGVAFAITGILTLVRIIAGPTLLDRMVAADMLLTTVLLAVGVEMIYHGHTNTIVLLVVIAATSFLATVMVARNVKRKPTENANGGGSHGSVS